jgi:hypothetical protein
MTGRKHLGRGLASVSHLFLSRPQPAADQTWPAAAAGHVASPYLLVASGAEVIAKAVVTCNVALELARRGRRTAVVDADPSLPTVRLLLGGAVPSKAGPERFPLDGAHALRLFDTLEQAAADGEAWEHVLVNAPADFFSGGPPPIGVERLLLVISPDSRGLIRSYAIAKRSAGWHSGLRLGIVVSGVAGEATARGFFEQFSDVLERQAGLWATYCGCLPEHDEIGRSVLSRVPAVLGPQEGGLIEPLRRIAEAVAQLFKPAGSARER